VGDDANFDIHIWDMDRKTLRRLTFNENHDAVPIWTPDGKRFFMTKPPGTADEESAAGTYRKINIVVNWLEEPKQRVPVHVQ
jgi:Tol biopolymer transport system component